MNNNRNKSNNNQEDEYEDDFEQSLKHSTYEADFEEHNDSLYSNDFEQTSMKGSSNKSFNKDQNSDNLYLNEEFEEQSLKESPSKSSKNNIDSLYSNDDFEQPSVVKESPKKDQNNSSLYSNNDVFESNSMLISKNHDYNVNLNSSISKLSRPATASINTSSRKRINNKSTNNIITKADIIRSRSANNIRPSTTSTHSMNQIQQHQSLKSPKYNNNTITNNNNQNNNNNNNNNNVTINNYLKFKLNSLPPWCFPSRTIPKELADHLFGVNNKESYVKISLFCKHNKHFSDCKEVLCADANEKYKWLNLIRHKGKLAYDLVCEADKYWRKKLHESLEIEIETLKASQSEQLHALQISFRRESSRQMKLLKQGVAFYESVEPLVIKGEIDAMELFRSTGWTAEHYNYFKKKLQLEMHQAEKNLKVILDKQHHAHVKEVDVLKKSIETPIQYLDRMFDSRIEAIHIAISRVDHTFEHSIMLAGSFGYGLLNGSSSSSRSTNKTPQFSSELKVIAESERHQRNSKHLFNSLKNSLKAIADICSDVRLMYKEDYNDINIKEHIKNSTDGNNSSPTKVSKNNLSGKKMKQCKSKPKKHKGIRRHSTGSVEHSNHYSDEGYDDYQSNSINKGSGQHASEIITAITSSSSIGTAATSLEVTEHIDTNISTHGGLNEESYLQQHQHLSSTTISDKYNTKEDEFDDDNNINVNQHNTDDILKVSHNEIMKQTKAAHADPLGLPLLNVKPSQRNDRILLNELMFRNNIPLSYDANDTNKHVILSPIERKKLLQSLDSVDYSISNKKRIDISMNVKDNSTLFEGTGSMMGPPKQSMEAFSPIKPPQQLLNKPPKQHDVMKCFECHKLFVSDQAKYIPNAINKDAVGFIKAKNNIQSTKHTHNSKKNSQITEETKEKHTLSIKNRNHPCFCTWECCKTYARSYCKSHQLYHTLLLIDIAAGYYVSEKEDNKK